MKRALLLGLVSTTTLAAPQPDDPRLWLDRMASAVNKLNYIGTFVHIIGDETETMRVIHRVDGNDVSERLVSLGGTGREVLRTNEETKCILQAEHAVLIDKHTPRTPVPLHAPLPKYSADLERYYKFYDQGVDRVAERPAHVIEVRPLDAYRFGYQLWLDEQTAIPLKSLRINADGKSVEQVMFTEISFPDHIDDALLQPTISEQGFTVQVRDTTAAPAPQGAAAGWEAADLPDGFQLSATDNEDEQAEGEHLVYSDGLTSVSVFIESLRDARPERGFSMVGGSSAFSTMVNGFHVTVVGEVPEPTARMIGNSMRPLAIEGKR
jgi:sigma-E factor negative regulatory protein RseB